MVLVTKSTMKKKKNKKINGDTETVATNTIKRLRFRAPQHEPVATTTMRLCTRAPQHEPVATTTKRLCTRAPQHEPVATTTKRLCTRAPQHEPVQKQVNWEKLPYSVMVEVFRYLGDVDRVAMSQVCRKFNKCFKDPSLWRERRFFLDGQYGEKQLLFLSIFGGCLHNVSIYCYHRTSSSCQVIAQNLETLRRNVKRARLRSFCLSNLELDNFEKFPELRKTVATCLIELFQTQTELETVKLEICQFSVLLGKEVLEHLTTSAGHELSYLSIENYFQTIRSVCEMETFQETLTKFSSLNTISVNYCYISDGLLRHWAVSLRQKLEFVEIKVLEREIHSHNISSETWRELNVSCPKLKVGMVMFCLSNADDIMRILQPAVPLKKLHISVDAENAQTVQLSVMLRHLADCFGYRLEQLRLNFENTEGSVDNDLIYLLQRCRRLESFFVFGNIGYRVANTVRELVQDGQRVLRKVLIVPDKDNDPDIEDTLEQIQFILNEYKNISRPSGHVR